MPAATNTNHERIGASLCPPLPIGYGAVACLAGILFSMVATQLVGLLYEALPPQTVIAGAIIEFVNKVVGVCLAFLGTALIAVGSVR